MRRKEIGLSRTNEEEEKAYICKELTGNECASRCDSMNEKNNNEEWLLKLGPCDVWFKGGS